MANTKKTYYYDFLPNKKDEMLQATTANNLQQVTRTLIEIRDDGPNPAIIQPLQPAMHDSNQSPWRIRKRLETQEVKTGKIHLTHDQVFENVFRYSSLESANSVVTGKRAYVSVCDMTDENTPVLYGPYDQQTYFEKGLDDEYVLGLNTDLVRSRGLKKGDEVGITFDARNHVFYFKIF